MNLAVIHRVAIIVSDYEKARAFYRQDVAEPLYQ